jgi:hypothetical protein
MGWQVLVSPAAKFITGVVLPVDGGASITPTLTDERLRE